MGIDAAGSLMGELVLWPDPRLQEVCTEIREDTDCSEIIDTMLRIKEEKHGLGIAAPQVGELVAIIVVEDLIMINPRIVKASDQMSWFEEGCLSFPETCPKYAQDMSILREGKTVRVRRHKLVKMEAFDRDWHPIVVKGRDWKGACMQHEFDHLKGITLDLHRRNVAAQNL